MWKIGTHLTKWREPITLSTSCCGDRSLLRKSPSHTHNPCPRAPAIPSPGSAEGTARPSAPGTVRNACARGPQPVFLRRQWTGSIRGRAERGPGHEHAGSRGLYPQVARLWASTLQPLLPAYHDAAARFPPRGRDPLPGAGLPAAPPPPGGIAPQGQVLANSKWWKFTTSRVNPPTSLSVNASFTPQS